jgi:hypothetical protein
MTIKIYNNSDTSNIYPVLSSGTAVPDLYLQAALMVPKAQLGAKPFPKRNQFRLYINPTGDGIPPNGNVTITLNWSLPLRYSRNAPLLRQPRTAPINISIGGVGDVSKSLKT